MYKRVGENVWQNLASKMQNPTTVFGTMEIQNVEVLEKQFRKYRSTAKKLRWS